MSNFSRNTSHQLLSLGALEDEVIYLAPEHFDLAVEISNQVTTEHRRWQTYLNVLALCSFEEWLQSAASDLSIQLEYDSVLRSPFANELTALSYLKVGEFNICLIVSDNLTDEAVILPSASIRLPELIAHFYVIIEILEEQEEAIIRGLLRYDKLLNYQQSVNLFAERQDNYKLPLFLFDSEPNHFLYALRLLSPNTILPKLSDLQTLQQLSQSQPPVNTSQLAISQQKFTCLSHWMQNIFAADWLTIENLLDTKVLQRIIVWQPAYRSLKRNHEDEIVELINQLTSSTDKFQQQKAAKRLGVIGQGNDIAAQALINLIQITQDDEILWIAVESLWQISPGNPAAGVRRVQSINLGMQVGGKTVALAVAMIQKSNQQFGILLQVYPTYDEPYLPTHLKLILLDDSGQVLREVTARDSDRYIQLKVNGDRGEQFSVRVALGDASITEHFEI
ncbi:DUF1822 family protein [Scytonema sp. UIC 10036]|uniref:DUF1822 family protein n=1 Tax=Scytonema sp. UIC 10036 TaxID=2304196 RepID=UPI0012DA133C|nr:DUF1822 family protein [Scytonema sp. UIC 10036]MUG97936.1 DUF1822 family protein [Scytonema sp. UIC 10036]